MVNSDNETTTKSTEMTATTKESLAYFRESRDQWTAHSRRKVQTLFPRSRSSEMVAGSSAVSSADGSNGGDNAGAVKKPLKHGRRRMRRRRKQVPKEEESAEVVSTSPAPALSNESSATMPTSDGSAEKTEPEQQQQQQQQKQQQSLESPTNTKSESSVASSDYYDRLVSFYNKHNPSKIDSVEATLIKYEGREEELFQKLERKYCGAPDPHPPPPNLTMNDEEDASVGPLCFLEYGSSASRVLVRLFAAAAPLAAENFRCLCTATKPRDDAAASVTTAPRNFVRCAMHRIVPGFCVQGGDITAGNGTGGKSVYATGLPGKTDLWGNFRDDQPMLRHSKPGLLSMANNGPNRNSSQFFFTLRDLPHLNGKHVVFGQVVSGWDVIERISALRTNEKQNPVFSDNEDSLLATIVDCGQILPNGEEVRASEQLSDNSAKVTNSALFSSSQPLSSPWPAAPKSTFETAPPPTTSIFGSANSSQVSTFSFSKPPNATTETTQMERQSNKTTTALFSFAPSSSQSSFPVPTEGALNALSSPFDFSKKGKEGEAAAVPASDLTPAEEEKKDSVSDISASKKPIAFAFSSPVAATTNSGTSGTTGQGATGSSSCPLAELAAALPIESTNNRMESSVSFSARQLTSDEQEGTISNSEQDNDDSGSGESKGDDENGVQIYPCCEDQDGGGQPIKSSTATFAPSSQLQHPSSAAVQETGLGAAIPGLGPSAAAGDKIFRVEESIEDVIDDHQLDGSDIATPEKLPNKETRATSIEYSESSFGAEKGAAGENPITKATSFETSTQQTLIVDKANNSNLAPTTASANVTHSASKPALSSPSIFSPIRRTNTKSNGNLKSAKKAFKNLFPASDHNVAAPIDDMTNITSNGTKSRQRVSNDVNTINKSNTTSSKKTEAENSKKPAPSNKILSSIFRDSNEASAKTSITRNQCRSPSADDTSRAEGIPIAELNNTSSQNDISLKFLEAQPSSYRVSRRISNAIIVLDGEHDTYSKNTR